MLATAPDLYTIKYAVVLSVVCTEVTFVDMADKTWEAPVVILVTVTSTKLVAVAGRVVLATNLKTGDNVLTMKALPEVMP